MRRSSSESYSNTDLSGESDGSGGEVQGSGGVGVLEKEPFTREDGAVDGRWWTSDGKPALLWGNSVNGVGLRWWLWPGREAGRFGGVRGRALAPGCSLCRAGGDGGGKRGQGDAGGKRFGNSGEHWAGEGRLI